MKLRTLASLLISLVLTACGGHSSSLSSDTSTPSSESTSSSFSLTETSSITSIPSSESSSSSSKSELATIYDGYYEELVSWSDGEDLKQKLYDISRKNYRPLNYTAPNYETNVKADHTKYDYEYLNVLYSGEDIYKNETNKGWQREHAWCASLMCGSLTANAVKQVGRATDFHNLFAAQASANGSRGNKNYGEADRHADTYQDRDTRTGYGYKFDSKTFEPGDYDKGRVSRAIFYMAMMYKEDEVDHVNGITMKGLRILEEPVTYVAGENGEFAIGNLSTLIKWNNTFPVDYLEMQHNISVYKDVNSIDGHAQGNRNPFVDFPDLVNYVYGDKKEESGTLASLLSEASETELHCESSNTEVRHYALKEAKRSYALGSQIQDEDYQVVKVLANYETEVITAGYYNTLENHTFSENDGDSIEASIIVDGYGVILSHYVIMLNPLESSSSGEIFLNTTGVNKGLKGEDQEVNYGGVDFIFNFDSSANISSSNTMTINNINGEDGPVGVTLGSGTKPLTKFTLTTKESYKIDAAYVKAFVGNVNSSYKLTIKVGESVLLPQTTVNNKDVAKVYGTSVSGALEGQLTYIFEGSTSLKINSVAFNVII